MRISDRYQSTIERVSRTGPVSSTPSSGEPASTNDGGARILDVNVSPEAKALSNRAAGIEHLKAQVQSGAFKVDPDAIASKLVGLTE